MSKIDLTLRIVLVDAPPGVTFSKQDAKGRPVDPSRAGAGDLVFDIPISLAPTPEGLRPGGGFVRADGQGRFVYIASGQQAGDPAHPGRRLKLYLRDLPADAASGGVLVARLAGRGRDGGPAFATVTALDSWMRVRS